MQDLCVMIMIVREAEIGDIDDIVEANRSDVENFYEKIRAMGDTPENAYLFGGQWMHRDSYFEHFRYFWDYGGKILVAEVDDRVVGHIEFLEDWDLDYGRYLYIYMLLVHKDYRGRGIGTSLVKATMNYARKLGITRIVVVGDDRSVGFYKKLGFNIADTWFTIRIPKSDCEFSGSELSVYEAVSYLLGNKYRIILGKFHGTRALLYDFMFEFSSLSALKIKHYFTKLNLGGSPVICGIREAVRIPNAVFCWSQKQIDYSELINAFCCKAMKVSTKILTAIPKPDKKFDVVDTVIWLKKDLH